MRGYSVHITDGRNLWCIPLSLTLVTRFLHNNFHEDWYRQWSNIKFWKAVCCDYWSKEFMKYVVQMASCGIIYLWSFKQIGRGIQAVLRFSHRHLRSCNIGISGRKRGTIMKHVTEMGSGAMTYTSCFIKIFSGTHQFIWRRKHANT